MRAETEYYEILGHKEEVFVYSSGDAACRSTAKNTYQCTRSTTEIFAALLSRDRISFDARQRNRGDVPVDNNQQLRVHWPLQAPGARARSSTTRCGCSAYGYNQLFYSAAGVPSAPSDPGNAPGSVQHRRRHRQRHARRRQTATTRRLHVWQPLASGRRSLR